jgi:hypothetical protein
MTSRKSLLCLSLMMAGSLFAGVGQALACGDGEVILEDKFTSLDPAWGFSEEAKNRTNGPDGVSYKIDAGDNVFLLNQAGLYDDYEACVTVKTSAQKDTSAYAGVIVWASDSDNAYEVDVFPLYGTYAVYRYQKGKTLKPISPKSSDAIKTGTDTTNEIGVVVNGKTATISINGQKVIDFSGQPPEGGSLVGFSVGLPPKDAGPANFTISDFQLRKVGGDESDDEGKSGQ